MANNHADTERPIHVVLEVPDGISFQTLMETISTEEVPASMKKVSRSSLREQSSVTVDLDILTEKQVEALELALQTGYYEQPRRTDLANLARELGISKSAVSQRLRTAEVKLIGQAFEEHT